jgi:uncharacterized protein involved in outer membrane biogenesis
MRRALFAVLGLLVLVAAGIVALQVAIARGAFTTEVDAALERATGRSVTHGAVSVGFGLRPRIVLTDAAVANLPGGSRPDFARIGRLEVRLALLPLVAGRIEIDSLHLADAEILLERDAEGRPNWAFGSGGGGGGGLAIAEIEIADARLLMPQGPVSRVEVARLRLARDAPEDPLTLAGRLRLDGEALTVAARLGVETESALPIEARIDGDGLRAEIAGTWPRRTEQPGWSLAIETEATAAAARRIASKAGRDIPLAGPLSLEARLAPGAPWPAVSDLVLRLGPTDAGALLPRLRLARAELRAAGFDGPATVSAQGQRGGADLGLTATLPSLRHMLEAAADRPWPVEIALTSGRSRLHLAGEVRRDRGIGATQFAARLATPDFAAIGPVLGATLPRLTGVTAEARMSGLFTNGLSLRGLRWTSDGVQAEGDLSMTFAPRLAFRGQVAAARLDLDALGGDGTRPRDRRRAIPDLPLPLATLRGMDAELDLSAAALVAGGTIWRDARTQVRLAGGRLAAEDLAFTMPGGRMAGRLAIDAAGTVPQASLALRSQGRGLDLAALRRAFGVPAGFEGSAEMAFDLRGRGASTRALAATLTGEFGVAMVGGRFTGATALRIGPSLARALTPRGTPAGGLALRCLAIRLSAEDGVAHSQALLMEGEFGRIDGSLAVNLRDETVAARLLPDIRVMGVTVRAPVHIGGTLTDARVGVDPGAALTRVIGDTVANRLWRSSTVEFLRGASGSTSPGGDCAAALGLARLGRAGPLPEAAAAPIPLVPRELQGTALVVVRGIGGLLGGRRR